jgi:hypothetical protein
MKDRHREAWTSFVEGRDAQRPSKYGNEREGKYASKREAYVATQLDAVFKSGHIKDLREQVPFVLVPADGKLRAVRYIADFVYSDDDGLHVVDVKGGEATKTQVYRLKRRLMKHIHGITIEEL